jgi:hypothetical protein
VTQKITVNTGQGRCNLARDSRAQVRWILASLVLLSSACSGYPEAVSGGYANVVLSSLSCSSSSITGAASDSCTITLSAAARRATNVTLKSNSAAVSVPATVTVPANSTSTKFTANASPVASAQSVTLTANLGGVLHSAVLELNATQRALLISPSSLVFGNTVLNTPSTLLVRLTSTGTTAVAISSATLSGTGFTMSGATFPVTLNPGLALSLDVRFDPTATGPVTGQVIVESNSVSGAKTVINLSGTGESAAHQVNLSWSPPKSSTDPVAGYYIYRSLGGSSSYQQLNSSSETQTTYVDSTVQAGVTYEYLVRSVDSSGRQSSASNNVSTTVP